MSIFDEEFKKKKKYEVKRPAVTKPKEYRPRTEVHLYGKNLREKLEGKKKDA